MPPEARLPVFVGRCELGVVERGRHFSDLFRGHRLDFHVYVEAVDVEYVALVSEGPRRVFQQ